MEGIVVGSNFFQKPSSKKKNYKKRTFDEDDNVDASIFRQTKCPKLVNAGNVATNFEYESSEQIQIEHDNRATASVETETEFSRDWQSICERDLKQADDGFKGKRIMRSGNLYKGINGYIDYSSGFRRELRVSNEKARGAYGPLRASLYIRRSVRFDYQPDICKDYKETGYCGYGDACKFMHDRGDYKSGWQLEKEWKEAEKARKSNILVMDHEKGIVIGDSLPSYCFICENPFVDPVVTKCNHYFCLLCALQHNSRSKRCIICNEPTHGLFNTAHQILQITKAAK